MQDEALGGARGASTRAPTTQYTLCLYRPRVAPGRGRHRRVAAQGPLPPAGDRVRARPPTATLRARAARSPGFHLRDALDLRGQARTRRASTRFGGHAFAAGLHRCAKRSCRAFTRGVRGRSRASSCRPRTCAAHARKRRRARAAASSRSRWPDALREQRLGPGLAGAGVRRRVRRRRPARGRRAAHQRLCARARRRALRGHAVQPRRPAARAGARGLPARGQRWQGTVSLELVVEHWEASLGSRGTSGPDGAQRRARQRCGYQRCRSGAHRRSPGERANVAHTSIVGHRRRLALHACADDVRTSPCAIATEAQLNSDRSWRLTPRSLGDVRTNQRQGTAGSCGCRTRFRSSPARGQGIGRATALKFAAEGAKVAVCDINMASVAAKPSTRVEAAGGEALGFARRRHRQGQHRGDGRRASWPSGAASTRWSTTPASCRTRSSRR